MARNPNEPSVEKLIGTANRLMKEIADCDENIEKQAADASPDDKINNIAGLAIKRDTILAKIVENIGHLLDAHDACNDEIKQLTAAGHSTTALEKRREAIANALAAPVDELRKQIKKFCDHADVAISVAYKLADDEKKPARFYAGINPSVFKAETDEATAENKVQDLNAITQVTISKADAAREVNRLLDLTSAKRIAEEMDIVTYHAEATRLFERVRAEFNDISEDFAAAFQNEILDKQVKVTDSWKKIAPFEAIAERLTKMGGSDFALSELHKRVIDANRFLGRYWRFVGYEKKCADLMRDDFASESSVRAYKDATRDHAERIERQGVLASNWTIGTGLAAAVLIAIVLIFLDNNLLLKNWTMTAILGAAALMYGFSVKFGRDARNDHMLDLRETLYARAWKIRNEAKSGAQAHQRAMDTFATKAAAVLKMRESPYFEFPKINWDDIDENENEQSKPAGVIGTAAGMDSSRRKQTHKRDEDKLSILARKLGEDTWSSHKKTMQDRNISVLTLIVVVPLALSLLLRTWGPTKTFSFVSQTPDQGACVLERGRLLLASGGSYFVRTVEGSHVAEIAKSAVLLIEPGEPKHPLPNCDDRRAESGPTRVSFDTALEVKSDQATLNAAGKIAADTKAGLDAVAGNTKAGLDAVAGSTKAGLDAIADKIGIVVPCVKECPPVTTVTPPAPFPVIVPVVVETQPPTAAPQVHVEGPTFTTLVQAADGTNREYSGQRFVVLPFFPGPVSGKAQPEIYGPDGINTEAEAFYFGLNQLSDPKLSNPSETLIQRIGNAFKTCMDKTQAAYEAKGKVATRKLTLQIEGYASRTWLDTKGLDGKTLDDTEKERLNWYLAEGRRAAVIRQLGVVGHGLIEINRIPAQAAFGGPSDVRPEKIISGFQFLEDGAMRTSLDGWLNQPSSDDRKPDEEQEILARSVVILIDSDALVHCGEAE